MSSRNISKLQTRIIWSFLTLFLVLATGTIGYWFIAKQPVSVMDCFYMTMITISTIGYGEIIDLSHSPSGRLFTVFIALAGIGSLTYILSNFTASIVEGEVNEVFRRRKMQKKIDRLSGHFIVCGVGVEGVGWHVIEELHSTRRPFVIVERQRAKIDAVLEVYPDQLFLEGDATDDDVQVRAGIKRAVGLFATAGDDNQNLVITLTAKQLNPAVKIVARSRDERNGAKMKSAGADEVVLTTLIGGLRMASVMIRPTVVSFLDLMLRDETNLRVEEVTVPATASGQTLSQLNLHQHPGILLLAVRRAGKWLYNPARSLQIQEGDVLICMATPDQRDALQRIFSAR